MVVAKRAVRCERTNPAWCAKENSGQAYKNATVGPYLVDRTNPSHALAESVLTNMEWVYTGLSNRQLVGQPGRFENSRVDCGSAFRCSCGNTAGLGGCSAG